MKDENKVTKSKKTHHSVESTGNILCLSVKLQTPLSSLEFYIESANLGDLFRELIITIMEVNWGKKRCLLTVMAENCL